MPSAGARAAAWQMFEFMPLNWEVELWGFEPQTSCMPSAGSTSAGVHRCRSPSQGVRCSARQFAPVAVLACCASAAGSGSPEALCGLPAHLGDELEALAQVQHGQLGQFRGGGDHQVRDRLCAARFPHDTARSRRPRNRPRRSSARRGTAVRRTRGAGRRPVARSLGGSPGDLPQRWRAALPRST
jgi:hypothetical protein